MGVFSQAQIELVFRKLFQDSAEDFALPFHNDVGPDPSFEEMKKVVCIDNRRPEFLDSWRKSQVLSNANLDWVGHHLLGA